MPGCPVGIGEPGRGRIRLVGIPRNPLLSIRTTLEKPGQRRFMGERQVPLEFRGGILIAAGALPGVAGRPGRARKQRRSSGAVQPELPGLGVRT